MQIFATWSGADFLAFYVVMLVVCVGLGILVPAHLRPAGRRVEIDDAEQLAVLTGGAPRHALTVLADLVAQRAISTPVSGKMFATATPSGHGRAASAVLRKVGDFTLGDVRRTLKTHAETIATDLERRGLLMRKNERLKMHIFSAAPLAALFLIGLYRQQAGAAEGEATGFLIALMGLTVCCIVIRLVTLHPRTKAGDEELSSWYNRASRLRRAPEGNEAALAVSLFGTGVLVGTPFQYLHTAKARSSDAASTGGGTCGGGEAGSGCGGGGCGG